MAKVQDDACQPVNIVAKPDMETSSCPDVLNIATPAHRDICAGEIICLGKTFVTAHCYVEACKCYSVERHNCTTARMVPNPRFDENAVDPSAEVYGVADGGCEIYLDLADVALPPSDVAANYDEYGKLLAGVVANGYTVVLDEAAGQASATAKKLGTLTQGRSYAACDEYISVTLEK